MIVTIVGAGRLAEGIGVRILAGEHRIRVADTEPSKADALAAAKRKSDAEYDAGTARLFLARVQAQLLERLSTGDIIQPRIKDPPAKDARDDYTPGGR